MNSIIQLVNEYSFGAMKLRQHVKGVEDSTRLLKDSENGALAAEVFAKVTARI